MLGREFTTIPTSRKVVALTFDAGGDNAGVASILATLSAQHVPGTFFMTGHWVQTYPSLARTIAASYRVGNHTMTHPHLTTLSDSEVRAQLTSAATTISSVAHQNPKPLFRFPYADRNAHLISVVNGLGYVPVSWTVDTLGWEGTGNGISVDGIVQRVLTELMPGEIVLMHVGSNPDDHSTLDADALPKVIAQLKARGYGFVTLDALFSSG